MASSYYDQCEQAGELLVDDEELERRGRWADARRADAFRPFPCHGAGDDPYNSTAAYRATCGRCGGDRRYPRGGADR